MRRLSAAEIVAGAAARIPGVGILGVRVGAERRRRRRPPRRRPGRARLARLVAVLVMAGAAIWFWHSVPPATVAAWAGRVVIEASADLGFRVADILVEGRQQTSRRRIRAAVGARRDDPILALDLARARARVEALPWVRKATIERRLPDTIVVRLSERVPVARWRRSRTQALVDQDGTVFFVRKANEFKQLPLLIGTDAPRHAADLVALLLTRPLLGGRVVEARRIGRRRWDLVFDTAVVLRLPEAGAKAAWEKFAGLELKHRLLGRGLIAIDLRLPDRLVLRSPKGTTVRAQGPGKDT